jgi:hypothetical protein
MHQESSDSEYEYNSDSESERESESLKECSTYKHKKLYVYIETNGFYWTYICISDSEYHGSYIFEIDRNHKVAILKNSSGKVTMEINPYNLNLLEVFDILSKKLSSEHSEDSMQNVAVDLSDLLNKFKAENNLTRLAQPRKKLTMSLFTAEFE